LILDESMLMIIVPYNVDDFDIVVSDSEESEGMLESK
jgi:hypothetical protein